jgi:hypothetical protein
VKTFPGIFPIAGFLMPLYHLGIQIVLPATTVAAELPELSCYLTFLNPQ